MILYEINSYNETLFFFKETDVSIELPISSQNRAENCSELMRQMDLYHHEMNELTI